MAAPTTTQPSAAGNASNGENRMMRLPCRGCRPRRSYASIGSSKISENRQSAIDTSIAWPSPVRSRCSSAARMPCAAKVPATASDSGDAAFVGTPSGAPVIAMNPTAAWIIVS